MRPEILNPLYAPVSAIDGIGPKTETAITRLLHGGGADEPARIRDLLFLLPASVVDRRLQPGIARAPEGAIVTLEVRVDRHQPPPGRMSGSNSRLPYRIFVHDETGELALVFFSAHRDYLEKALPVGEIRHVSGRVEWFNGRPTMVHPDYIMDGAEFAAMPLVEPVYPGTAGLARKTLRKAVTAALDRLADLPEWNTAELMERNAWPAFRAAIHAAHHPGDDAPLDPLAPHRQRLAHDEFFAGQLAIMLVRERMRRAGGIAREFSGALAGHALAAFPHTPTGAQLQAISEISADLRKPERMLRLLQGDVGSGKTLVAMAAIADVVEAGAQAAIMAPTEILARQHATTLAPLCQAAGITMEVLTGREKGKQRESILERLRSGETQLIAGTHALFQGTVEFRDLGLAVIDEQHRFGVHQRLALGDKARNTDMLVMTATPIPRTLIMTWYGDMDVSRLDQKPAGRRDIATIAMPLERLEELAQRIEAAIANGQKTFWICPLVEESEELDLTSAQERHDWLKKRLGGSVGLVHGRMSAGEKDASMEAFRSGETQLLVATTVIEVGVDVPDATIIVIEHAERFGLSQMHQLRGRVGRSDRESHCILLYKAPLGETATARLNVMRETNDGFRIAEEDLRLRGEGEVLGTRQSGTPGFRLADPALHAALLPSARDQARLAITTDPALETPRGAALRTLLYLFGKDQAVRLLRSG